MNSSVSSSNNNTLPGSLIAFVSATHFILFVVAFAFYVLVFTVMLKNRKDFAAPYYKYIVSLAVGEFLYAAYTGIFGGLCTALGDCPCSMFTNTVISGISLIGWPIEVATDIAIAVDRVIGVCFYWKYKAIFDGKVPLAIISATWIYALVYEFPTYSLLVPIYYDPGAFSEWSNSDWSPLVGYVQMCADFVMLAISTCLYVIIFVTMWKRRKQSLSGNEAKMRRIQRSMVIQACGHYLFVALDDVLYYGYVLPYNNSVVVSFVTNVVYMVIPLSNSLLLLLLNIPVREKVCELFRHHTWHLYPLGAAALRGRGQTQRRLNAVRVTPL